MQLDLLTFVINNDERFIINVDCVENIIHSCGFINLSLVTHDDTIIIGKSILDDFVQELEKKLKLALPHQLKLHRSIKKYIGYYWNQSLNEDGPDLFFEQGKESSYWVGEKYLLWTTDSHDKYNRFATWLYNDEQGNIIFEVTPTYPDTFIDPQDPADVLVYQEWMENTYRPFFIRIIPQGVAAKWLDQAYLILNILKDNAKKFKNQEK